MLPLVTLTDSYKTYLLLSPFPELCRPACLCLACMQLEATFSGVLGNRHILGTAKTLVCQILYYNIFKVYYSSKIYIKKVCFQKRLSLKMEV